MVRHSIGYYKSIELHPNYKGIWNVDATYYANDIVKYYSSYYYVISGSTIHTPPTITQVWGSNSDSFFATELIDEPVGFDDFKITMKRAETHGVSVESSVGELEFYNGNIGNAYDIVKSSYEKDLDSELNFISEIKCNDNSDWEELYSGMIDLSTYSQKEGDYCACVCKVAEIGAKTTFNNRIDTEINLKDGESIDIDGNIIESEIISKNITIPAKEILFKDIATIKEDDSWQKAGTWCANEEVSTAASFPISFGSVDFNECECYNDNSGSETLEGMKFFQSTQNSETLFSISGSIKMSVKNVANGYYINNCWFKIFKSVDGVNQLLEIYEKDLNYLLPLGGTGQYKEFYFNFDTTATLNNGDKLYAYIYFVTSLSCPFLTYVGIYEKIGTSINISYLSKFDDSDCSVIMVFDAFRKLTQLISGIDFESKYYNYLQNNEIGIGAGGLKCLTNGLNLRKSPIISTVPKILTTSFKDLFKEISCIDNIGFGFVDYEGVIKLKVDHFSEFYENNILIEINNPSSKSRQYNQKLSTSKLSIGYTKYSTIDDANSIDSFHTERTYNLPIKAISKEVKKYSNIIADPYAIEFTRRKSFEPDTSDYKFDENMFIFCLKTMVSIDGESPLEVDAGVINSNNSIISPSTIINARISPARNALRYSDYIFMQNSSKYKFNLSAGTGNIKAAYEPNENPGYIYVDDYVLSPLSEDSAIEKKDQLLSSEIISFEYPITMSEYKAIKSNPYGKIVVDGEDCWLSEIIYSPSDGVAEFKLIPSA